MTIEIAFALTIFFGVVLARVSQRTILVAGQSLGFVQIAAGMAAAAVLPSYTVYMVQFHPSWAVGLEADATLVKLVQFNGLWAAMLVAALMVLGAGLSYALSVKLLCSDKPGRVWFPALFSVIMLAVVPIRGNIGDRVWDGRWPPGWIAGLAVVLLLGLTLLAVHRYDVTIEN